MLEPSTSAKSRIFHELDFDKPGKQIGYLRVPQSRDGGAWSTIEVPIAVVNGARGPAVLFTGGVHGDEYEAQIAISRLARRLDPQTVRGKVILMPAVDLPAALAGRRMCPIDGRDFNRCLPGDARGSFCQMLAHFVDSVLLPQVEALVDVHAAGNAMEAALASTMHWVEDPAVVQRTKALAESFAAPYNVMFWGVDEGGTMCSAAERRGVLAISSEIGGYGRVSVEGVRVAERGLDNVLKWLGHDRGQARHLRSATAPRAPATWRCATSMLTCSRPATDCSSRCTSPAHRSARASWPATCTSSKSGRGRRCRSSFAATASSGWRPGPAGCSKGDVVGVVMQPYSRRGHHGYSASSRRSASGSTVQPR